MAGLIEMAAAISKLKGKRSAKNEDKHVLYQESVQGVDLELDYVSDIFEKTRLRPLVHIREDFCGTALSSCEWVTRNDVNTAIAVDIDSSVLEWGKINNVQCLDSKAAKRVFLKRDNVLTVKTKPVDACLAFNFSYWVFQERNILKRYFTQVRKALVADGIFFLDVFGGYEAYRTQVEEREMDGFTYIWEQASYNPISNDMQCYIHFEFPDGSRMNKAFSYRWRLWSCMEIRDLLMDAGFSKTRVFAQSFDNETDEPLDEYHETDELPDYASWIGYIVAEK